MTSETSTSLRKAALLLRSLDGDSATVLLSQLSAEEARAVREAMRALGDVDPDEQQELREELRRSRPAQELDVAYGVELDLSPEVDEMESLIESLPPSPAISKPVQPFDWLEGSDLPTLAAMLDREHLSTVAVVLSHLPPDRASQVLAALPFSRRTAALERLVDLGESDNASLEVIERQLADWIAVQKAERQRRADRLRSIQAILEHSPRGTCDSVLNDLARTNRRLAEEIGPVHRQQATSGSWPRQLAGLSYGERFDSGRQKASDTANIELSESDAETAVVAPPAPSTTPVPPFEIVGTLTSQQLTQLFHHCTVDRVVLALAGASDTTCQQVERRLPKAIGKELRRRMHTIASVRLSDLSDAQREVASQAVKLFGMPAHL